eukprot:jgi/Hompol1/4672/HPOL_003828-RA
MIVVEPQPGFVAKSRLLAAAGDFPEGLKVFINLCHSPELPQPPAISETELARQLDGTDPQTYRIPLSLSPAPRSDVDKSGSVCIVFDVCVHSEVVARALKSKPYMDFLVTMSLAWIETKHELSLSPGKLSKMRCKGILDPHVVRKQRRPFIAEVNSSASTATDASASASKHTHIHQDIKLAGKSVSDRKPETTVPQYSILQEPKTGTPEFLVVRISLPLVKTLQDCQSTLDIEKDRLILDVERPSYKLDIALPFSINIDEAGAQFDRRNRTLSVTASVAPK